MAIALSDLLFRHSAMAALRSGSQFSYEAADVCFWHLADILVALKLLTRGHGSRAGGPRPFFEGAHFALENSEPSDPGDQF